MQRCLSGLRSTIGNRVMQECIRRFESSSLRHEKERTFGSVLFLYARRRDCRSRAEKKCGNQSAQLTDLQKEYLYAQYYYSL